MYNPPPKRGDNALLQGPIMMQDMVEVSQSQRHFIFKLEQKCYPHLNLSQNKFILFVQNFQQKGLTKYSTQKQRE